MGHCKVRILKKFITVQLQMFAMGGHEKQVVVKYYSIAK